MWIFLSVLSFLPDKDPKQIFLEQVKIPHPTGSGCTWYNSAKKHTVSSVTVLIYLKNTLIACGKDFNGWKVLLSVWAAMLTCCFLWVALRGPWVQQRWEGSGEVCIPERQPGLGCLAPGGPQPRRGRGGGPVRAPGPPLGQRAHQGDVQQAGLDSFFGVRTSIVDPEWFIPDLDPTYIN